jgi:tetratricopeptide (TPR) repeat protein
MLVRSSVLLLNLSLIQSLLHHLIFYSIDFNHKHLQQITVSSPVITVTQIVNNPNPNLQSKDPSLFYNRGNSYLTSGEFQKALEDFNQAASLSPTDSDIYISRGIVYEKLLRWDDAIHDYETANSIIKKVPFNRDNAIVYSNLANAETGRFLL